MCPKAEKSEYHMKTDCKKHSTTTTRWWGGGGEGGILKKNTKHRPRLR